jgi:hypothetical protein
MPDPSSAVSWSAIVSVAFGSSVLGTLAGKLFDRGGARSETTREGYADAVKALNAWGQFPLRVYRRVDDAAETLVRLEAMGAQIKEALAYCTGWVGAESTELGTVYNELVELLRTEVTIHARLAWANPPASTARKMNLAESTGDAKTWRTVTPAEWLIVQLFSTLIQYRIGWRRYLWIRPLLRRRIARLRIVEQAEVAFRDRPARMLNYAPIPDEVTPV